MNSERRRRKVRRLLETDGPTGWVCSLTIAPEQPENSPTGMTLDHVVPLRNGGTHDLANLRLAHRRCNEWRGLLGLLARVQPDWVGDEIVGAVAIEAAAKSLRLVGDTPQEVAHGA